MAGIQNQIQAYYSVIGGGQLNEIETTADVSTIGGGDANIIYQGAYRSTIGGGYGNEIQSNAAYSTIAGGTLCIIQNNANYSTIGGGINNVIGPNAYLSMIGGGANNYIQTNTPGSTISGGTNNFVSGKLGVIPGGDFNAATNNSFAAGHRAKANDQGAFVWADATDTDFADTGSNTFNVRASGGVTFATGGTGPAQTVSWTPGTGAWSFTSDRNAKEHFTPVDAREVLEKVAKLPLTEWNYKGYGDRHVGPMAQDFHEAFPFNTNDKMLNSADEAGVTLAAVQGLNEKLDEKDAEIYNLRKQNDSLAERLNQLEATVKQLAAQK